MDQRGWDADTDPGGDEGAADNELEREQYHSTSNPAPPSKQ